MSSITSIIVNISASIDNKDVLWSVQVWMLYVYVYLQNLY